MRRTIVLLVATFLACADLGLAADGAPQGGSMDAATTVKSSKSNSSERTGGTGAADGTVKGSKSNTSERGKPVAAGSDASTVKSGKSNSSD